MASNHTHGRPLSQQQLFSPFSRCSSSLCDSSQHSPSGCCTCASWRETVTTPHCCIAYRSIRHIDNTQGDDGELCCSIHDVTQHMTAANTYRCPVTALHAVRGWWLNGVYSLPRCWVLTSCDEGGMLVPPFRTSTTIDCRQDDCKASSPDYAAKGNTIDGTTSTAVTYVKMTPSPCRTSCCGYGASLLLVLTADRLKNVARGEFDSPRFSE